MTDHWRPPRTLPIRTLYGDRRAEHDELTSLTTGGSPTRAPVIVVNGPGGIGASSSVITWANSLNENVFPGGVYHIDLRECTLHEALRTGAYLYGVAEDDIPEEFSTLRTLYQQVTAAHQMLVVADHVHHPRQVEALRPTHPASALVATSNCRDIFVADASYLELAPLTLPGAEVIATQLLDAERATVDAQHLSELLDLCDGAPKPLCRAISKISKHPYLGLAEALEWTKGAIAHPSRHHHAHLLADAAGGAYSQLSPVTADIYRYLGIHSDRTITQGEIATVVEKYGADENAIAELVNHYLLQPTEIGDYHMAPLVKAHAHARAEAITDT